MRARPVVVFATSVLLLAVGGCPRSHPRYATVSDARAAAVSARDAALAARDARDASAALEAAERAVDALAQAEALSGPAPVTSSLVPGDDALRDLRRAAREAREVAQETDERVRLEADLSGLKAKAYREVRAVALSATFKGLAAAAREADTRGLDALPPAGRDAALSAASWAATTTGRPARADGSPDWAGIATDMDALAAAPPRAIGVSLAIGFAVLGKHGLALLESEALDPAAIDDPAERLAIHVLRCFVRNSAGYRRLALLELDGALAAAGRHEGVLGAGPVALKGGEVIGGAHLLLAVFYLHEKDHAAGDRELALALQAWPDNPVSEFLTGERLLASGERERAADSLEQSMRGEGEDAEWLAAQVAARARAIRDGEADPDDGLIGDPAFLTRVALHALWKAAERSPEAARARAQVERGRAFCRDLLAHLPGLADEPTADAATVDSSVAR